MRARFVIGMGILAILAGCDGGDGSGGSGGTGGTGGSGGMGGMGGHDTTAGGGGSGGSTSTGGGGSGGAGGGSGAPLAPTMDSVAPLEGGLHIMWTNNTPDCTKIELDRKKDDGAYATEFTLTGAAESQHDGEVTAPGTYCYKARCIKGDQTSPDSNEKCGTP